MNGGFVAGDSRFFAQSGPQTLEAVAAAAGTTVEGDAAARIVTGVAPLQLAGPGEVSFLDNKKYAEALAATRAGAVIVHPSMLRHVPEGCVALTTAEPYLGWAKVAALFHPAPPVSPGIHALAVVDVTATVDPSAEISPFVVIGPRAEIGAGVVIGAGSVIGAGVTVGADSRIGAGCTVTHARIGARVVLYPGVRIGQDGFGFATSVTPSGPVHVSVPQLGRVIVEDDVQVGANSCIDRGSAQDTVIGAGSRLDNLVQVGHNVKLGRACVIVAQVGIAGSTILEDFVVVAGQAGLAGHLRIGRGAKIGAQAGVMTDVPAGRDYVGSPAQPVKDAFREVAILRRLVQERFGGQAGGQSRKQGPETG